ncbi:MAG TPA: DUF2934 domain-containing protein [Candidatus Sulfotelmatobacter sp.]|jgi:hypothetical protein
MSKVEPNKMALDIETRRRKQQELLVQMVERMVRSRAQQLYELRGQTDGQDLQDWYQAELEVLETKSLASLYRRLRNIGAQVGKDSPPQYMVS